MTDAERFALLIACERLELDAAENYVIEPDVERFGYKVAIYDEPTWNGEGKVPVNTSVVETFVGDEEIFRRSEAAP